MPVVGGVILQCFTMVFVAGMQILGPLLTVRRNSYIVMVSVAFGLGVAMEPQVGRDPSLPAPPLRTRHALTPAYATQTVAANGVSSFHGKNLDFNYGLWPGYMVCKKFPTTTPTVTPESCVAGLSGQSVSLGEDDCMMINGTYTAAVMGDPVEVKTCTNKNGACCKEWDAG